jgi:hypothetical protein
VVDGLAEAGVVLLGADVDPVAVVRPVHDQVDRGEREPEPCLHPLGQAGDAVGDDPDGHGDLLAPVTVGGRA